MKQSDLEDLEKLKKAAVLSLLVSIYSAPVYAVVFLNASTEVINIIFIISIIIATFVSSLLFYVEARKTKLGFKGNLSTEKNFLINELPSIIQIITILSFLSFYLANANSRAILSLVVVVLLYLYLNVRRFDYIKHNISKNDAEQTRPAAWHLNIVVSVFLASIVYFIAENLSTTN